jgi:hypothetical protein
MRSATVLLSNLRSAGPRPPGRNGKPRQRDAHARACRRLQIVRKYSIAAMSRLPLHRRTTPRTRPVKKGSILGFAAMVLH